jgi:hypothetical protein
VEPGNENGLITRGEMSAHMRTIAVQLHGVDVRLKKVEDAVGANARWVSARMTRAIDQLLPIVITTVIVWFAAGRL